MDRSVGVVHLIQGQVSCVVHLVRERSVGVVDLEQGQVSWCCSFSAGKGQSEMLI